MKKNKKKLFTVTKKKVVFSKGPIHLVDCDVVMRDSTVLSRQIIEHPGAVVIIPKLKDDSFILVRQFRFAAGAWLWEWPAGGVEKGESLKTSASRELMEEAGFKPNKLTPVLSFYPTPGISSEVMHMFLAEDLSAKKAKQDDDEDIEIGFFSLKQIKKMIEDGMIIDGKTVLGYYLLKELLKK